MSEQKIPYKIYLSESEMPTTWYNMRADMKKKPAPLLNPTTHQPMTAEELEAVFCRELVKQELDNDNRYIPIPQEIQDFYKMYRPAPLVRAYCLEKKLDTPAKIYYKFEGNNTSGSHKLNSAIAQAYYAKQQGLKGVTTETGAGQWGTALSMACSYFDLDCKVYHGKMFLRAETLPPGGYAHLRCQRNRPPHRRPRRWAGKSSRSIPAPAEAWAAPSPRLWKWPLTLRGTATCWAACLNQVLLHQSIIGAGDQDRHGQVRYPARHHHRLCRRRLQPGRPDLPLHGREAPGRGGLSVHRRGACFLSHPDQRPVRLRLL